MEWKKWIPSVVWISGYRKEDLAGDLSAGLTVGIMLIPQGMAYAMIAGLPPIYGLYAATLPLIIYGLLGTSRQLAVGPVAMVSLLTAAGIGSLAAAGTESYILLAIALAFIVGVIQFFLGIFRLGFLVNFLSHPVVSGFTSAAALIIGLSQLKHLLGIDLPKSKYVHEILLSAFAQFENIHAPTLALGISGIAAIYFIRQIKKAFPGQLIAMVIGILAVWSLELSEAGVTIVGAVPSGLPPFSLPAFSWQTMKSLLPVALTISLVGFMESIAVAKAIQAKHKNYKVDPDQELLALGLANVGGALFQSFPVTGGFSRTAVNDQAGARTGLASLISAALVIFTLLFLTSLFYYLPNAILAAVIMVAVAGLIDYKEAIELWHHDRSDFWMLIATFAATLILGIEEGIVVGVVLSLALVLYRATQPHIAELGRVPGTDYYRNIERFDNLKTQDDLLILRFDADIFFANTTYFKEKIDVCIRKSEKPLKAIIVSMESVSHLDSSAMQTLEEMLEEGADNDIQYLFTAVKGPVRDIFNRYNLIEKIGEDHFFMRTQDAVNYINGLGHKDKHRTYVLQTKPLK